MMQELLAERAKTKGLYIWLPVAIVLAVQTAYVLWALLRWKNADFSEGWAYFLYQLPLLSSILMPVTITMIASRMADAEHKGETFRLLQTLQSPNALFNCKLLCGLRYVMILSVLQTMLVLVLGLALHFGAVPWGQLALFLLNMLVVGSCIYLLAQIVSLLFRNQSFSLIIGIGGSFMGLFFPPTIQKLVLFAYYGVLSTVEMEWNEVTRVSTFHWTAFDFGGLLTLLVLFFLLNLIGRALLARKEF